MYWNLQSIPEQTNFKYVVKRCVYKIDREKMISSLNGSKGDFYKELYTGSRAPYLRLSSSNVCKSLARLRLRNSYFKCETGTWNQHRLDRESRICNVCRVYEDEEHIVLHCPRYLTSRKFLPRRLQANPNRATLIEVLNSGSKVELALMATFLRKIKGESYNHYKSDMIPLIRRRRSVDNERRNRQVDLDTSYVNRTTNGENIVLEQSWSD